MFGAIELGGTKVNVAVAGADGVAIASARIATTTADETLAAVRAFFRENAGPDGIQALGVGAFGPVVINPDDSEYGKLLPNPKPGWSNVDLLAGLAGITDGPVVLTTDVGAAGIAEAQFDAMNMVRVGVYVTIGTGIGAAIIVGGKPIPALLHPEIGHFPVRRAAGDNAPSCCAFHDSCAEGLAAGPAIMARWGKQLDACAPDGAEVALISDYVGQMLAAIVLAVSPERIVLGGGVAKTPGLIPQAQAAMERALNGYVAYGRDRTGFPFIVPPALGDAAGITGAMLLAIEAHLTKNKDKV